MPELPEVNYLSQTIIKHCKGKTLESIELLKGRYVKHGPPKHFKEFIQNLPLVLTDVIQKGKVMALCFNNECIISRLGLTGWWYINKDKPSWIHSDPNVVFKFKGLTLNYVDPLSYGTLHFLSKEDLEKEFLKLAPDYMSITLKELQERLLKKPILLNKTLEDVLVDQHALVSGIGNYLKAEILYDVKLSPFRTLNTLQKRIGKLFYLPQRKSPNRFRKTLETIKNM